MSEHDHEHNHSENGHSHDVSNLSGKKIFWVTVLNATITIAEIIGGILSGSLALLSDAVHNLSDTVAIALSYFANRIAQKPQDEKRTYGYKRAEILSAFVNATVLLALSMVLIIEAIKRWQSPENIDGTLMIIVASIGLVANFVSVFLLEKDAHENIKHQVQLSPSDQRHSIIHGGTGWRDRYSVMGCCLDRSNHYGVNFPIYY